MKINEKKVSYSEFELKDLTYNDLVMISNCLSHVGEKRNCSYTRHAYSLHLEIVNFLKNMENNAK